MPLDAPQFVANATLKYWATRLVRQMADSEVVAHYEMSEEHIQLLAVELAALVACTMIEGTVGQA
jgi:hypothetical protein